MDSMFNSDQVTEATIDRITRHYGLLAAQIDSPEFRRAVTLLVRVANGDSVATSDQEIVTLIDATTHVLNVLFCTPFSKRRLPIPDTFWHEPDEIGPVLYQVRVWLKRTLVNYTDADTVGEPPPHLTLPGQAVVVRWQSVRCGSARGVAPAATHQSAPG